MSTFSRVLRENGGDAVAALRHLAASYDYICGFVSPGMMRADPVKPVRPLKPPPVAIEIEPDGDKE